VETASEVHLEHLFDVEKAKLESYYNSEMRKLMEEIEIKRELCEEARKKNVELTKQLTEQNTKLMKLQKVMTRAGRNDSIPIDSDISAQFVLLKSDILQMVKSHLSLPEKQLGHRQNCQSYV
jgi:hypothetical protein